MPADAVLSRWQKSGRSPVPLKPTDRAPETGDFETEGSVFKYEKFPASMQTRADVWIKPKAMKATLGGDLRNVQLDKGQERAS